MLEERYGSTVEDWLVPADSYHAFPAADDREAWEGLLPDVRCAVIAAGEEVRGCEWPPLPAALYMEFSRTGNRSRYERRYFQRRSALAELVIAECAEGAGRFLDDIVNGLWSICEESTWVVPAHNRHSGAGEPLPDVTDPFIDLFAGDTGALLALTHNLLGARLDAVSDRICSRLRAEVKARILDPFLSHDDFWWMGSSERRRLNNWSPWCVSNCLAASLLLEADQGRRARAVRKAIVILDRFLAGYHADGGCDEGPGYWTVAGGALLDCLELLHGASGGAVDVYGEPLIQEIGRYIHRVHISGDYYVNFADCNARLQIPAGLVYRYGRRTGDEELSALGSWAYAGQNAVGVRRGKLLRALADLFCTGGIDERADPPLVRDVWLDGIEVMVARERGGSDDGLYLAAKGGHNDESHNHNDVGSFIVYCDGAPVMIDAGVGTYTAKTFSAQRYELWTMQSAYHNLPTVNGVQQQAGERFSARDVHYHAGDDAAELSLDIAGAYPEPAGIRSWRRTLRLARRADAHVEIVDDFALAPPAPEITLSLMTACAPSVESPGVILLSASAGPVRLTYDPSALAPSVERIELDDERLCSSWGDRLFRIVLRVAQATDRGVLITRIERG